MTRGFGDMRLRVSSQLKKSNAGKFDPVALRGTRECGRGQMHSKDTEGRKRRLSLVVRHLPSALTTQMET